MVSTQTMADKKPGRPRKREEGDEHSFTVRIPKKLHRLLRLLCADQDISINDAITLAVKSWAVEQPNYKTLERLADKDE
jgi:predicted HicB family RNase H-like nuclease